MARAGTFSTVADVQRTYDDLADRYEAYNLLLLPRTLDLRARAVEVMGPQPGESVLELGCGQGHCFTYLMDRIGPSGRLIGVDASAGMLAAAQDRLDQAGWNNVELIQEDAATVTLDRSVDHVLFSLSLSVIPDYRAALRNAAAHARRSVVTLHSGAPPPEFPPVLLRLVESLAAILPLGELRPGLLASIQEQVGPTSVEYHFGGLYSITRSKSAKAKPAALPRSYPQGASPSTEKKRRVDP